MASGFRIAEAFVSVKADSTGLRGEVDRAVKEAGAGQDIKVKLGIDKAPDMGGLMSNLAPFIMPTVAAVGQLSGVLGLVPAAAGAAGLAYGTLKVGMSNFADSLKTGDTPAQLKKANEALADLSPNARAAALTVRGLGPAWDSVKLDVQNRLFAGMSGVIQKVAKADLPVLRSGMDSMSGSLNLAAKYTGDWLASAKTTTDIKTIFENSSVAGQNLARAIQPILGIIRDIATVGSQFLPALTSHFADAAQKAADFVSNARDTGKLHEWIQTGIDAVKKLWGSFTDLFDIIKQISQNSGPVSMLDVLKLVTGSVRWLVDNFPELIPIIEGILVVMKLWKIAQLALNAVTEANPWVLLVTAIAIAAYEIYTHWDQVKKFLDATWQWIKSTSDAVWTAIKDFFSAILKSIHDTAVSVWNSIKDFFTGIWNSIRDTATSIWNGIAGFFTAAFNNYRNFFQSVWGAISGFFTGIWNTIRDTATNVWNGVSGFLTGALNNFKGFFSGVWNGIVGDFNNIWGRVTGIAQNIWNSVVGAFRNGVNAVIGLINDLVNGADTVLGFLHIALIPHVPALPGLAGGGTVGGGFQTNGPMAIVGEGNPAHPEYVIPTDPAHRGNALALYQSLGAKLMAGGGIIDWIGSTVSKVEKWAGAGATGLMNQAVDGLAGAIPAGMFRDVAVGVGHNIVAAIKALVDSAQTAFSAAFTGSPDLAGWIQAALGLTGTPGTWAGPLSVLIGRESGGNPNAINLWDSNAAAGHPSQGLMQTIPGTFSAYHQAGTSWNILDPVANIAAGINYIKARYGSIFNVQQSNPNLPPKGYDAGGLLPTGLSLVRNSTGRPERVLSAQQTDLFDRLIAQLERQGRRPGRDGGVTVNVAQTSGSPAETGRFVALALRTVG